MLMPKLVAAELHHGNQRNFNAFASRRDAGKHPRNLDVVGERQQGLIHDLGSADGPGNGNARHVGRIAMHEIVRVEMMKVAVAIPAGHGRNVRSEEHKSDLQSLMRISYAVFCLKKKTKMIKTKHKNSKLNKLTLN